MSITHLYNSRTLNAIDRNRVLDLGVSFLRRLGREGETCLGCDGKRYVAFFFS